VNRSLTEGRRRFFDRFAQIESGSRCRRFEPLLSAACDGEATAQERRLLEAHLRSCQACRAVLRGFRAAPTRLAELVPPALVLPLLQRTSWCSRLYEAIAGGAGERAGALGYKLQQAGELVSAQKAAAVVASTAALAGGAAVSERTSHHRHSPSSAASARQRETSPARVPQPPNPLPETPPPSASGPSDVSEQAENADVVDAEGEFSPEPVQAATAAQDQSAAAGFGLESGGTGFESASRRAGAAGAARATSATGAQEFGP
jgi:hypothetical protein